VVKVTVEAMVDGEPTILVSAWTSIPANSTAPVQIDAGAARDLHRGSARPHHHGQGP
jgi:hypothetical protein